MDLWGIGKKVFIDRFSKKKYDEMNALYGFYDTASDDESDCGNQKNVIAEPPMLFAHKSERSFKK